MKQCSYCYAPDNGTCAYPSEGKPGCLRDSHQARGMGVDGIEVPSFTLKPGLAGMLMGILEAHGPYRNGQTALFWHIVGIIGKAREGLSIGDYRAQGMKYKEIAKLLGVNESTVKSRYYRGTHPDNMKKQP